MDFTVSVLFNAILAGTAVLYAALGEIVAERSGVINLGVEGVMLVGASAGFAVAMATGSPAAGVIAAAFAGALLNMIFAFIAVTRRANQLATGLTLTFLGAGLSALIGRPYVGRLLQNKIEQFPIPGLSEIPFLGRVLFDQDILVYLVVPVAVLLWWLLFRTRWGLRLRAVGENRTVAFAAGLRPAFIQYQALFIAGLLGGIGGAHLSLAFAGAWQENMTVGRGFIAVALVIFAAWNPLRAILGAMVFGGALALQVQLQAAAVPISPFVLEMMPYLLTLAVLLYLQRRNSQSMPEGLKEVFEGTN